MLFKFIEAPISRLQLFILVGEPLMFMGAFMFLALELLKWMLFGLLGDLMGELLRGFI